MNALASHPTAEARIIAKAAAGTKFEAAEVDAELAFAAKAYLNAYTGAFAFLLGMQHDLGHYGHLSAGQVKGVLNCMVADAKRDMAKKPAAALVADILDGEAHFFPRPLTVRNGYYTVVLPDGSHRTIRVAQARQGVNKENRQFISLLTGPANTSDYTRVAKVEDRELVWFRGYGETGTALEIAVTKVLSFTRDEEREAGKLYAVSSKNCWRCGALLTDDLSIERNIGPVCYAKEYAE